MKQNEEKKSKLEWKKPEVKVLSIHETMGGSFGGPAEIGSTYYES